MIARRMGRTSLRTLKTRFPVGQVEAVCFLYDVEADPSGGAVRSSEETPGSVFTGLSAQVWLAAHLQRGVPGRQPAVRGQRARSSFALTGDIVCCRREWD